MTSVPQIVTLKSGQPVQLVFETDLELIIERAIATMQRTGAETTLINISSVLVADGAGEEVPVLRLAI